MQRIAIFASGTGSNAIKIIEHFKGHPTIEVSLVLSNNAKATVVNKAVDADVEIYSFNRESFYNTNQVLNKLKSSKIDLVVLAGFMWLVPENLVREYSDRIINIHPALLPKFGGKGFYGINVHKAVFDSNETETGVTIHFIDDYYDTGPILLQEKIFIKKEYNIEDIATKVLELEHKIYPLAIKYFCLDKILWKNNIPFIKEKN